MDAVPGGGNPRLNLLDRDADAGSQRDDEACPLSDEIGAIPGREIAQRVLAHQEVKLSLLASLFLEYPQRVSRVRRAWAIEIDRADREGGGVCNCEVQHREPIGIGAEYLIGLMRWASGREENDLVKVQLVPHDFGDDEMADVDRVKGATEDGKLSRSGHAMSHLPDSPQEVYGAPVAQYSSRQAVIRDQAGWVESSDDERRLC